MDQVKIMPLQMEGQCIVLPKGTTKLPLLPLLDYSLPLWTQCLLLPQATSAQPSELTSAGETLLASPGGEVVSCTKDTTEIHQRFWAESWTPSQSPGGSRAVG